MPPGRLPTSNTIRDSVRVGFLLCVPALVAWLTGRPFIFPSLGPSAFSLVVEERRKDTGRAVIFGHLIGVTGGLVAYYLLARGLSLAHLPTSFSIDMLRLAGSSIVSVVFTSAGMLATRARHAPACATTLIVSLGLLSTLWDALFIMVAISLMYAVHRLLLVGFRFRRNVP